MSDLRIVCDAALSWAGEYGFTLPDDARAVILAVYALDPGALDERNLAWAQEQASARLSPATEKPA